MIDTLDESSGFSADSVEVTRTAEPLEFELDEAELGRPIAEAGAKAVGDGIRAITTPAREKHPLFNRSGKLANGIEAMPFDGEGYPIAAPEGYLQDPALVERLIGLVPALSDPLDDPQISAAIEQAAEDSIKTP